MSILDNINDVPENDKAKRREMAKTFQRANRRIQNIERAISAGRLGYSPAYDSVIQYTGNRGGKFSKFHMTSSWSNMVEQTAQAEAFLNSPTSTARGARAWQRSVTKGITRRNGDPLSERETSGFMRAVFGSGYDNDSRFQQIAEHYILGNDEYYSEDSEYGVSDFVEDALDAATDAFGRSSFFSGGSVTSKEGASISGASAYSSALKKKNRTNKRSVGKAISKFRRLL